MIIDRLTQDLTQDRDPTSGFWYGDVGGRTAGGITVNENVAMTLSACWACTRALAAPSGYLPFNLHRKVGNGGCEVAEDHKLHTLLHDAPNEEMGAMLWRCMGIGQQVNSGNTFAEIERTYGGDVVALWPIHPARVEQRRDESKSLYYSVRNTSGPPTPIPAEDMFHVPSMMTDDGLWGKGVIRNARETIAHAINTETYGSSWFKSGGRLSAVLKHPKRMDKEARDNLRREWKSTYGGADGDKLGILWEGMDYMPIASDPEDSQFILSRQHNIEEIARWYGVPPHMIQHLLRATFNNIEELGLEFVRYSLLPWLKLWEQEVWRKLLNPAEKKIYFAKFNVDALERGDTTKRTAALAQQFFNGALTINQWMALEDRNPIGELGDVHFVQSAMVPLEIAVKGPQKPVQPRLPAPKNEDDEPAEDETDDKDDESAAVKALRSEYDRREQEACARQKSAAVKVLEAAVARMLAREANEARKAAKKPVTFGAWIEKFYETHSQSFIDDLEIGASAYLPNGDSSDLATQLAHEHIKRSKTDLHDCEQGLELSANIEAMILCWNETRKKVQI